MKLEIDVRDDKIWNVTLSSSAELKVQFSQPLPSAQRWLDAYLSGQAAPLPPLAWERCTPFQREVLQALLRTPFGATTTYGELATAAGRPRAARAVGNALNANPFPLFIPCHRVLAKGGPGGFACGAALKQTLLSHEKTQAPA